MPNAKELIEQICEARDDYTDRIAAALQSKARSGRRSGGRRDKGSPSYVAQEISSDWQNAAMDMAMSMGEDPDTVHGDPDSFGDWVGDELYTYWLRSKKTLDAQAVIDELEDEFRWMRGSRRVFDRLRRNFR